MVKYHAMLDHWEDFGPPVYIAAAAYLGLTKKRTSGGDTPAPDRPKTEEEEKYGNLNELASMFVGSGGLIQ